MTVSAQPIWTAYSETGALAIACPHCGAAAGKWCSRADGRLGRIPHIARMSVGDDNRPRDFSEPRHGREA